MSGIGVDTGFNWMAAVGAFPNDLDAPSQLPESGQDLSQEINDLGEGYTIVALKSEDYKPSSPPLDPEEGEVSPEQYGELSSEQEVARVSNEPTSILPSQKWNLTKGQVGLISVATAIVVIAALIVGLYFGNANAHDFLVSKVTIANTLLYAGVPVVGLALVFGLVLYVYKKHQKRLSDVVTDAMIHNKTIGNSTAYAEPRNPESRESQRKDLEAALDKQRLAQWGITLKGLLPTRKQLGITAIVLLVLAGLAVGGYFLCTHVPAVQHWVANDLIPAFNHQIEVWEAIAYSGAVVVGLPLVVIAIKKLVPSIFTKVKASFGRWEDARNRCQYTDSYPEIDPLSE